MKKNAKLMTSGSISKNIILFAIPISLGNLFQQLYNIVDIIVAGNFIDKEALSSITASGPLLFLLIGFFIGIFIGAGVVISKYFGQEDEINVNLAIHTDIAFAIISSVVLTFIGVFGTPLFLRLMHTPEIVIDGAITYTRIYFVGISSLIMYNCAAGILSAVGDSKHPLYFLIISSLTNIVLDLIFVIYFKLGIKGIAYATVIGQSVSAILAYRILITTNEIFKVKIKDIRIDKDILIQILKIGIPSGIQNSVASLSNVIIQSSVNSFGAIAVAGNGIYLRIEAFAIIPLKGMAIAMTTFISQNLGAGKYDRVKKGARFGFISAMALSESVALLLYLFMPQLLTLFTKAPDVIAISLIRTSICLPLLFIFALCQVMAGVFRGAGKALVPMFVMIVIWCIFRASFITLILQFDRKIQNVFIVYPITWTLGALIFIIYYFKADWMGIKKLNNI
jgi:putative MATE family efflux protein